MDGPVDVDALLLLSFGGPEGPDDVRPFLENVTRGRNVPPQRLDAVAQHYLHFGGVSPINRLNRELVERIGAALAGAGRPLPVYFGNRNWHPLAADTVATMAEDGVRTALVLATSAYGGYSACRQYHEDIAAARAAVGARAPHLVKLRQFFDHPLFVRINADAVRAALDGLGRPARVVFTAHSVPAAADAVAGPPADGGRRYSRQLATVAALVAQAAGVDRHDLAWQSRSGPPSVPWLEPDILDHLDTLPEQGVDAVVVCPVGFVSDHLEVLWDLDEEARAAADKLGLSYVRTATAGADPRFADLVVELVAERVSQAAPRALSAMPPAGAGTDGSPCAPGCCQRR